MNKCPWCGKEYSDEVVVCTIDGHALQEKLAAPPAEIKELIPNPVRPTSISVIGWFLTATACLAFVATMAFISNSKAREIMNQSPVPYEIQVIEIVAGFIVTLVSGIGMLRGFNWARTLYIVGMSVRFTYTWFTTPASRTLNIPGMFVFLVITFFLFRPVANRYFGNKTPEQA